MRPFCYLESAAITMGIATCLNTTLCPDSITTSGQQPLVLEIDLLQGNFDAAQFCKPFKAANSGIARIGALAQVIQHLVTVIGGAWEWLAVRPPCGDAAPRPGSL